MAGYATDFYMQRVIDHFNGVAVHTPQTTMFVALTTVVLTRTDVVMPDGVELVGFGYTRVSFANDATFWTTATLDPATAVMTSTNILEVDFPDATDDFPPVPGWAILDDPIAGNVHHAGSFGDQIGLVSSGQTPFIEVGSLQIPGSGA